MITNCARTREVLAQSRDRGSRESLRDHVEGCAVCADALRVERFMRGTVRSLPQINQLPDPTKIWWQSRVVAHQGRVARATLPIRILERIAFAAGATGVATGVAWVWPSLRSSAASWISSLTSAARSAVEASSATPSLLFATAILGVIAFGLYTQWAEE